MTDLVEEIAVSPKPDRPAGRVRRVIVAGVVVLALITAGTTAALVWSHRTSEALASARAEMRAAAAVLEDATARADVVLTGAESRLDDDALLGALDEALVAAGEVLSQEVGQVGSRQDKTARAREITAAAAAAQAAVMASSHAVVDAVVLHEITTQVDAYAALRGELEATRAAAGEHLASSEGRTLDDTARVALTEAIEAADAVLAAEPLVLDEAAVPVVDDPLELPEQYAVETVTDGETRTLDAQEIADAGQELQGHVAALSTASGAVAEAEAAWQGEQERLAAERAAAAAAAQQRSTNNSGGAQSRAGGSSTGKGSSAGAKAPAAKGGSSSGSSGSGSTSGSGGGSPSGSGGGSSSGGGTWVESGPGGSWCETGDTSGADFTGGWC